MVLSRNFPLIALILLAVGAAGCSNGNDQANAYGQFEADEVTISAQAQGELERFTPVEGEMLDAQAVVGRVGTTQQVLQRDEIRARKDRVLASLEELEAEKAVLREEIDVAERDLKRFKSLMEKEAATQKQVDDVEGKIRVLKKRLSAIDTKKATIRAEIRSLEAQEARLNDQIAKASVTNPFSGRVLNTLAEQNEVVRYGQPLYTLADMDTLTLRVYISGAQLSSVSVGDEVTVRIDETRNRLRTMQGRVSWVANEAEFTPQMIQTREKRVAQVYAMKVRVPNPDGTLKIGMPGEVVFQ